MSRMEELQEQKAGTPCHLHSQADLLQFGFFFFFSDFGNRDILSKPGFFLCQQLNTD